MFSEDQLAELKSMWPSLSEAEEGGLTFIRIDGLRLADGCEPRTVSGLLCPVPRDGYQSRLFISAKISHKGKGQNWNPQNGCVILNEHWWAVSWKTARQNQRLTEMMLDHLRAFQP